MSRYGVVATVVLLLVLIGCKQETSDERLVNMAVNQKEQETEIASLSGRIERLEKALVGIQQSLEKTAVAGGAPVPAKSTQGPALDFRETPEYQQIVSALSAVRQTQQNVAREQELEQLRDVGQAFQAMGNPQEMDRRLTLLIQNFSSRIDDPVKRQQFAADVQQLRQSLTTPASVQDLYQRRTAELTARLNEEQDQRRREFIQRELASLQTASAEDLEQRFERYQREDTMRQVRELQQKYDIPRETLRDSGIPTMGRGPGGFGDFPGGRGR